MPHLLSLVNGCVVHYYSTFASLVSEDVLKKRCEYFAIGASAVYHIMPNACAVDCCENSDISSLAGWLNNADSFSKSRIAVERLRV
jgi:hypothetical protein